MVRIFQQHDIDRIIEIWLEASIQSHHFISPNFWKSKASDMRESYIPDSETYVFEHNGVVEGFLSLHENDIAALFVAPASQNKGIGTRLMARAKALSPSLRLTVYKENARGIRFYERNGFTVAREQIDEHTGHPELLMVFP